MIRKKHPTKLKIPEKRPKGWMVCGFDTSMSSISGAAIGWDATLKKLTGPTFTMLRWAKEDEYYDRLNEAVRAHELVLGMQQDMGLILEIDEIFIAQEEPWPLGMARGGMSSYMKQQAEISGAFLGGLLRWGFRDIWQVNSIWWRKLVADMISDDTGEDVTTYAEKWRSAKLTERYNCKPKDSGKFRSKQWALDVMAPFFGQMYSGDEIPDWPDIIESPQGKKPRPEKSKAKAVQPDDRYDSLAVMWWLFRELKASETITPTGAT